jgi:hypothetical protein
MMIGSGNDGFFLDLYLIHALNIGLSHAPKLSLLHFLVLVPDMAGAAYVYEENKMEEAVISGVNGKCTPHGAMQDET